LCDNSWSKKPEPTVIAEIAKNRKNLELMVNPENGIVLAIANASEMASHALRRWYISSREVVILNFLVRGIL